MQVFGYKLIDFHKSLNLGDEVHISYRHDDGKCNVGGVFGYRHADQFDLLTELKEVL